MAQDLRLPIPVAADPIAPGAQESGSDCCDHGALVPIDIAFEKGLALAKPVAESESLPLMQVTGRVLADTITTPIPLPPFDNAAMDGYGMRTTDLEGDPPYTLAVEQRVAAGDDGILPAELAPGSALRILTGAPVPQGINAVVMQEHCTKRGQSIELARRPVPGENIRRQGEDCRQGRKIIAKNTLIDSRHTALLAAIGMPVVNVHRRVRVAFFSTGSELRQPGQSLAAGQIYNSNRFMLASQLQAPHIDWLDLGAVPDEPEQLGDALDKAARFADLVMTTGGVSVGDEDHMPHLVRQAGGEIHVMKVAIKPGKPLMIGTIGKTIYIGLPGNPVAAFVNCLLIVDPIIRKLAGLGSRRPQMRTVTADFARARRPGRQEYIPAQIVGQSEDEPMLVKAFQKAGSATLMPLAEADGFVIIPADCAEVSPGDALKFMPFPNV